MVHVTPVKVGRKERMSFAKIDEVLEMPNLMDIQKKSYEWFITEGLNEVFAESPSITDYNGNLVLDFIGFTMEDTPKYSVEECKARDATYAAPLKVRARLLNKETGEIKEQEIYMGDFPLMTETGTFVINGAERVIVSQLVRSPGAYFGLDHDKTGKELYSGQTIPNRGAWLEYETDANDTFFVRIDKNRKIHVTTFLRTLNALDRKAQEEDPYRASSFLAYNALESDGQIREFFGDDIRILSSMEKDPTKDSSEALKETYRKLRPGEPPTEESAITHMYNLFLDPRRYDLCRFGRYKFNKKLGLTLRIAGRTLTRPVADPMTGEILAEAGETLTKEKATLLDDRGVDTVYIKVGEGLDEKEFKVIGNGTVKISDYVSFDCKQYGINERVRFSALKAMIEDANGDEEALKELIRQHVVALMPKHITIDDIIVTINYLNGIDNGVGAVDDIDHLGNRRIRCCGELLQNQFRIGFSRMERVIRERMTIQRPDADVITPQTLINTRPVVAAMKEFFGSSPLSQFMDQTNPLAELTHKRRLSALGPGGLSRDRAGFEVRDVHHTHYGRMCPIETPEGPNIGLISYLATYARVDEYGFIEAPYRKVDKERGVVTNEIEYMTADIEDNYIVAQANEPLDKDGRFLKDLVTARHKDEFIEVEGNKADYMDVSPKMMVSVATTMIPFLENDNANRALMGANMQRQAVPLLTTESPIVGTGMEYKAAVDSGVCIVAKRSGTVTRVTADEIQITADDHTVDNYHVIKFLRSNNGTCINQRPIVNVGQHVEAGDVIGDGPATSEGEISLGKNMLIGFMTWEGYNYEDAVLINEKLVRNDVYTSIHIEEYEIEARDTKLGAEEITRDIPNVSEEALRDLDERGIIRIGAEVRAGDILVGKVTPKGETELTAEERLLRAIFGEKAREVRDTSLKVPHGEYGIVVDVRVFTRENSDELNPGVNMVIRCYIAQKRKLSVGDKMAGRHGNKGVVSRILPQEDMPFLPDGTPLDIVLNPLGVPSRMNIGQVLEVHLGYAAKQLGYKIMTPVFDGAHEADIREWFAQAGVVRDPFEGEHYLGKPLYKEVVCEDGKKDYARLSDEEKNDLEFLNALAEKGELKIIDGKMRLYDGRTGEPFDNPVTVGYMYFLKLHHLVDDKIHARSTGPYSLVTQQPLGGKAQFGGQRFGEMEVWALEAYGAAYTLQEILTVKSDDMIGRVKTYEAIVKGHNIPHPGVPESFKVLVRELQSLGLDVKVLDDEKQEIDLRTNYDEEYEEGIPPMIGEVVADDMEIEKSGYAIENIEDKLDEDYLGLDDEDSVEGDDEDEAVNDIFGDDEI